MGAPSVGARAMPAPKRVVDQRSAARASVLNMSLPSLRCRTILLTIDRFLRFLGRPTWAARSDQRAFRSKGTMVKRRLEPRAPNGRLGEVAPGGRPAGGRALARRRRRRRVDRARSVTTRSDLGSFPATWKSRGGAPRKNASESGVRGLTEELTEAIR